VLTWTPGEDQGPGTNTITVRVYDNGSPVLSATNSFVVVVNEVNRAPVAADDSYSAAITVLTVAAPGVLANDSDVDVPANILTAALISGPAHGTLVLSAGGGFSYTPAAGYVGTDRFTYTVSDGYAHATGTVHIAVHSSKMLAPTLLPDGNIQITFAGIPGFTYFILAAVDLAMPNWEIIGSATVGANGLGTFTDLNASNYTNRFYRAELVFESRVAISRLLPDGKMQLTFAGVPSRTYYIQATSNLETPIWETIGTSVPGTNGVGTFIDLNATNYWSRYYRTAVLNK
jgi:hypothetical protein